MRNKALHIFSILLLSMGVAITANAQIKILGNVYGGGDQAAVQGNTHIEINKGLYGGEIFGGGNGALNDDGSVKHSADIAGNTTLTISGGKFIVDQKTGNPSEDPEVGKLLKNNNIYGGGNNACVVGTLGSTINAQYLVTDDNGVEPGDDGYIPTYAQITDANGVEPGEPGYIETRYTPIADGVIDGTGNTTVTLTAGLLPESFFAVDNTTDPSNPTSMYRKWGEYIGRIEGMTAAKVPDTPEKAIQGSVFGAGYGVHTSVLGNTSVNITIGTSTPINTKDEILAQYNLAKRGGDASGETLASQFVITAFGGGYDGTVGGNTDVQISGSPMLQNVFGGGLGSKSGADASGGYASTVGTVSGSTNVAINGGTVYNNVYGGGAGIFGEQEITIPERGTAKMPYYMASMVHQQTDVTISNGTVVFGNVYGGGDIANTGWYDEASRPTGIHHTDYINASKAKLDLTTALHLEGGNVMGMVFGGGNGRKKAEIDRYNFVGAVIGNTSVVLGKKNDETWEPGTKVWNNIYGGGQSGSVYSCAVMAGYNSTTGTEARSVVGRVDGCTNVEIYNGDVGNNIFGGGWGDDPDGSDANKTSADISGNTYVYFEHGYIITDFYWDQEYCDFLEQYCGELQTNKYEDQIGKHTRSDLSHNLYGGGNEACVIGTKSGGNLVGGTGNVTVYMIGAPSVDSQNFYTSDFYLTSLGILGSLHFSAFGGGFGMNAKVLGNINNNIALKSAGLYSIVGGGMNGTVDGICRTVLACKYDPAETNQLRNTRLHNVYGGGYYAPVGGAELNIAEAFITDNVFGGGVMGNIDPANVDTTKAVTKTTIGLLDGESFTVKGDDGSTTYTYEYNDHRNRIYIGGNVYGGNDVSGTVNGVAKLNIHGGTIGHNVYGAGNGDHIGYYVPDELLYDLGAHGIDNYFPVVHHEPGAPNGKTYVGRPQTIGGVELTLEGNTTNERVTVLGQVFGGGNSCTIGAWDKKLLSTTYFSNPHLVRDDPAYFLGGGKIDMNLGSHITIGRTHAQLAAAADSTNYLIDVDGKPENVSGLYMGCSGHHLATQDWAKTNNYYHHYYDASTAQYWPGFAVYQENSDIPLTRQEGLQSFLAYMNNILVWSDDVNLNIKNQDNTDADDIWISNFVGGGFRGSMKAKTKNGQFHYTLPRGVTIGHDVIGGAFNTDVVYRIFETSDGHAYTEEDGHYKYLTDATDLTQADEGNTTGDYHHIEYAANGTDITGIVRFYYDGGMLSELPYGTDKASNDRIDRILKKYSTKIGQDADQDSRKDFAGAVAGTQDAFNYYKRDALVYLELDNRMQVEYVDGHVHGGNVFGGCFSSGRVEGDVWTDYRCYQESQQANSEDFNLSDQSFNNAKDFENNFAMMLFGAGYGANTNIQGSAYVRVLHPEKNPTAPISGMAYGYPRLYNVFGGSYEGKVEGNTNIYFNPGKYGYVTGAIYGGGCNGYVGGKTFLELAGGYIDEAYGGARNANVGGGTHIWAYDGQMRWWGEDVIHADGSAFVEADAEKAPLFIGKLYGGTDISGQICTDEGGTYTQTKGYQPYYSASYWPKELYTNHVDNTNGMTYIDSYLQVGGTEQSDNGFPIIGSVYAAGNGENTEAFFGSEYDYNKLPHQHSAMIEVSDGNIVYAFGGGNRATVTDNNYILVRPDLAGKHTIEDLGVQMYDVMKKRILSVGVDCYDEKLVGGKKVLDLKNASIQRLFGGNNIATMSIQPKWQLISGRVNDVYSGGNMGDMTYYNPEGKPATKNGAIGETAGVENNADGSNSNYKPRGLSITIEHPNIHIGSLYGGCRLSDVNPTPKTGQAPWPTGDNDDDGKDDGEDFYGATINITDGYVENVYGGNDISGTVYHGTNVNISGAVSGNVYGSGNGFYLYKWDKDATQITEHLLKEFDTSLPADDKTLCYTVPASAAHGSTGANNTQKLLTINDARPSVEKAFLNIAGIEGKAAVGTEGEPGYKPAIVQRVAYVKGNVYCGGNASTVLGDGTAETNSFTKFKIGSYVTLNGVFMGSDGYAFSQKDYLEKFEKLNSFDLTTPSSYDAGTDDKKYYPNLLSVYLKAVEMKAQPKEFNLNLPLHEAYIGTYCGGGNRGSMLVDKKVELDFHHDIVIYDKIVGACFDANVEYKGVKSYGGYTRPLSSDNYTKMRLNIASQFAPLVMDVPVDKTTAINEHGENFAQAMSHGFLYPHRDKGDGIENTYTAGTPYGSVCNIYGGCYQSGEVMGDIEINVYSNMLRYANQAKLDASNANGVHCFNVYGAGFGMDSHVWGNVGIRMDKFADPDQSHDIMGSGNPTLNDNLIEILGTTSAWNVYDNKINGARSQYPSANNIFGGGRNGELIGNAKIDIKNGLVFSDVVAGCYVALMHGSGQVIVGYPKYYECTKSGEYDLNRPDKWNTNKFMDAAGKKPVIVNKVNYLKGELVPNNVWNEILSTQQGNFTQKDDATLCTAWDDVDIRIGGGIYGGGYSRQNSMTYMAGSYTTMKLSDTKLGDTSNFYNFNGRKNYENGLNTVGYGGNVSIMVGDRIANGTTTGNDEDKDHIHISTLKAEVALFKDEDYVVKRADFSGTDDEYQKELAKTEDYASVIGKFIEEEDPVTHKKKYTHQGDQRPVDGQTYYNLTGSGGIYGDGHLVFCEGFRAADITGYGYAEGTVKHPVLMNTFQRLDMLNINDCCLMLQGAQDFATDLIDATVYSMTRVSELNMTSSLNADGTEDYVPLSHEDGTTDIKDDIETGFDKKRVRNYMGFFNNIHFLGSIVSDEPFFPESQGGALFHGQDGAKESASYYEKKQGYITKYAKSDKLTDATNEFKKRNVGTARNVIGINNGYCLRIQNQYYKNNATTGLGAMDIYYGPVIGVVEVKLLTLVEGEGGGYVYADNVHAGKTTDDGDTGTNHKANGENFLNVSGNFVFPGIVKTGNKGDQYIVDDCFPVHFGTNSDKVDYQTGNGTDAEAHYWYVEGNKYFFNTTLTGYTFSKAHDPFEIITNDKNILLSGLDDATKEYNLRVKKVVWSSAHTPGYESDLEDRLGNEQNYGDIIDGSLGYPYQFTIEVGEAGAWKDNNGIPFVMDRKTNQIEKDNVLYKPDLVANPSLMPIFNVKLYDNVDNAPADDVEGYYKKHLAEPEVVKIMLEARAKDTPLVDSVTGDPTEPDYVYTVTMRVVYLQGPSFQGGPSIKNCALPGERIQVTSEGVQVITTDQLPVTEYGWRLLHPDPDDPGHWITAESPEHPDANPEVLDDSYFDFLPDGNVDGYLPAYYFQNGWNVAYAFKAGGTWFYVPPMQTDDRMKDYEKQLLIHNYHRMKEAFVRELEVGHIGAEGARIYIEDEDDMAEFIKILNGTPAVGTEGEDGYVPAVAPYYFKDRNVYLMKDMDLSNASVFTNFKGTFDGFGHTLTIKDDEDNITGDETYDENATLLENYNASIKRLFPEVDAATDPAMVVNLLVLDGSPDERSKEYQDGSFTYKLNKYYLDKRHEMLTASLPDGDTDKHVRDAADKYVELYYENGDYQYAGVAKDQTSDTYYLRTELVPNYGSNISHHNSEHTHDTRRWDGDAKKNIPLYEKAYATRRTYDSDNDGDFNDYIYFGQQIAKVTDGSYSYDEKRPYAIRHNEPLATYKMDVDIIGLGNMDNRVFRAECFYHSSEDEGLYHNKNVYVFEPTITAVAFGDESMSIDQPEAGITGFYVDSNADYDKDGNAVSDDTYSNENVGHVTQNLLVYAMKSNAHDRNARNHLSDGFYGNGDAPTTDKSREQEITYHSIDPLASASASGALFNIANFHLVDKQDFNAPYAFDVTGRAWYERMPPYYRNVTGTNSYYDHSAWEGIVLPFTVKKVTASENDEISHFYGNNETLTVGAKTENVSTLHHEYWLTGMVATSANYATFARPSKDGDGLFVTGVGKPTAAPQQSGDYDYSNSYFWNLVNSVSYKDDSDTRDDLQWYKDPRTFNNYVYQTAGIPYLISFPGNDFYEFSMEGTDYDTSTHTKSGEGQIVTFDALPTNTNTVTIPVTDGSISPTTIGTGDAARYHIGTYLHHDADEGLYGITADGDIPGAKFVAAQDILPFRTYMATSDPGITRAILINSYGDDPIEEEDPEDELQEDYFSIYGYEGDLIVESSQKMKLQVYTAAGQLVRVINVKPGSNIYHGFQSGIYLVGGKKVAL